MSGQKLCCRFFPHQTLPCSNSLTFSEIIGCGSYQSNPRLWWVVPERYHRLCCCCSLGKIISSDQGPFIFLVGHDPEIKDFLRKRARTRNSLYPKKFLPRYKKILQALDHFYSTPSHQDLLNTYKSRVFYYNQKCYIDKNSFLSPGRGRLFRSFHSKRSVIVRVAQINPLFGLTELIFRLSLRTIYLLAIISSKERPKMSSTLFRTLSLPHQT